MMELSPQPQRHAVLGLGGVGGLISTMLSAGGESVAAIVRNGPQERLALTLERSERDAVHGTARLVTTLEGAVDVLWITPKATQLRDALRSVASLRPRSIVPLLNGLDHVALLREMFGRDAVVPATISVEAEKVEVGRFRQSSPFVNLVLAEAGRAVLARPAGILAEFGVDVRYVEDEQTLLWAKLAFLAPFALATSATGESLGFVRDHPEWRARLESGIHEVVAVARACGASLDARGALEFIERGKPGMRSSMLKDIEAGREPELDAIGGAVLRAAQAHGVPVPTMRDLIERTRARIAPRGAAPNS
ncbi:MAG: ketopantoate reductase family protein [Vulcanimicrobiaceae bacterium]